MEIIGVIDLRHGRAVHAVAGERARYGPVRAAAGVPVNGDAVSLARVYLDRLGVRELYVADLDAILDGTPQPGVLRRIVSCGAPTSVDAAVTSVDAAQRVAAAGAAQVIVGLETLPSWAVVEAIVHGVGSGRVAFSLDLRDGSPLGPAADDRVEAIAGRAARAGVATLIVVDLARVGTGAGVDVDVIARVRTAAPGVRLVAGGGVRGPQDVDRLAATGCDAVLVATALHDGRLGNQESGIRNQESGIRNQKSRI